MLPYDEGLAGGDGRVVRAPSALVRSEQNGSGKQKVYFCWGKEGGCPAEVRAFKISTGEWSLGKIESTATNLFARHQRSFVASKTAAESRKFASVRARREAAQLN